MKQSFSVVSVIKEDRDVLRKFCRYYSEQGADLVRVYFDGTSPIQPEELPANVEIIEISGDLRAQLPEGAENDHIALQTHIFTREQRSTQSDWLLVVDADEYVTADSRLDLLFASLPQDLSSLRFPVGEAVWRKGDDIDEPFGSNSFRFALGKYAHPLLSPLLYGRNYQLFRRGLLGHCAGKHAVRSGQHVTNVGCHHSQRDGQVLGKWSNEVGLADAFVAHFDAIDRGRWVDKLYQRAIKPAKNFGMGGSRLRQVQMVKEHVDAGTTAQVFGAFYGLKNWQHRVLRLIGAVKDDADFSARIRDL